MEINLLFCSVTLFVLKGKRLSHTDLKLLFLWLFSLKELKFQTVGIEILENDWFRLSLYSKQSSNKDADKTRMQCENVLNLIFSSWKWPHPKSIRLC